MTRFKREPFPLIYLGDKEQGKTLAQEEQDILKEWQKESGHHKEGEPTIKIEEYLTSDRLNLNQLRTFYHLAKYGQLTKASKKLRITQPALSRQLSLLEDSLGERLFFRTSEGLYMTQQGGILFRAASRILAEVTEMRHMLKKSSNKGLRQLRIGTTSVFSTMTLSKVIPRFIEDNNRTEFTLVSSNDMFDLKSGEVDVLIWPIVLDDESVVSRPLKPYHYGLFASPEYLKKYGEPKSLEELNRHRILAASTEAPEINFDLNWHLKIGLPEGRQRKVFAYANNTQALNTLGEEGLGIISAPTEAVNFFNLNLVPVLPEVKGPAITVNFLHLKSLGEFSLINNLYTYLLERLK